MTEVLILLGSKSDLTITEKGLATLKELGVSFELKICSAHRTPVELERHMKNFESNSSSGAGSVYICIAGMSAHLAGVVASQTLKPVIAVPVVSAATAGLDALLSMSQMPGGIPVATMGFGSSGFLNACLLATQILAGQNPAYTDKLARHRMKQAEQVIEDNKTHGIHLS